MTYVILMVVGALAALLGTHWWNGRKDAQLEKQERQLGEQEATQKAQAAQLQKELDEKQRQLAPDLNPADVEDHWNKK